MDRLKQQDILILSFAILAQLADAITTYIALKHNGIYETVSLSNCLISN